MEAMARQIATASGPCGNNRDYLFRLEKALFDIGHEDEYVIELAKEVRRILITLGLGIPSFNEKKNKKTTIVDHRHHCTPCFSPISPPFRCSRSREPLLPLNHDDIHAYINTDDEN